MGKKNNETEAFFRVFQKNLAGIVAKDPNPIDKGTQKTLARVLQAKALKQLKARHLMSAVVYVEGHLQREFQVEDTLCQQH